MATLYIGNKRYSSWSMRPWVLMKALNIPFDEKIFFFAPSIRQPAFGAFSPSGKVPTLALADGTVIHDSLAIVEYLAEDHPAAWPRDRAARAYARCAAAEMHAGFPALRSQCGMNVGLRVDVGVPDDALRRDLDRIDALWTEGLTRFAGPWLAGADFTAVDAFFAPVASRLQTYGLALSADADAYARRLLAHPAVAQWVAEGLAETARCEMHEADVVRDGRKIVEDLCK
ncbi:hypothetical protein HYQ45_016801 [Verticillium longisporum]|uniref:GST N-terminal domain-containing protein n=1 Tax=Verticillium longisporum TaxID=100787 RepID=A0A8I3AJD0_VERLO|nr:hypothetical protein HYQ45_016801 [Verticillium longisporum]